MPNRKQNIAQIADACKKQTLVLSGNLGITYRSHGAIYDISGKRPVFLYGQNLATNQFVIDGMRLAAQRVIDKRLDPVAVKSVKSLSEIIDAALKSLPKSAAFDPAKPGSDYSELWLQQFGRARRPGFEPSWIIFDEASTLTAAGRARVDALRPYSDVAGDEIARLAKLPLGSLAIEYRRYVELAATNKLPGADHQDYADLIDDIACMRFGVGFYAPGDKF